MYIIHTYTQIINTYLPSYLPSYLPTYLPTFFQTDIQTDRQILCGLINTGYFLEQYRHLCGYHHYEQIREMT
jgi:hypothetical protein